MKNYRMQDIDTKIRTAGFLPLDVLLVGSTGVGKSSTLNALFGESVATVGEGVDPETMEIQHYKINDVLRIWDSPGLGDGMAKDENHERRITNNLCETYTHDDGQWGFIDLVIVILDGSSRDMGTTYRLLEQVILRNIQPKRVIVAINKADMAMSGRSWNKANNKPQEKLSKFLEDKATSVQNRLYEATSLKIRKPVYYSAEKKYNLSSFMDSLIDHIPSTKRSLKID
jgi:predicted GTPase